MLCRLSTGLHQFLGRCSLYLVANGFPVKEDFFLQEFKKTWREELEVLNIWLLGRSRSLEDRFQTMNFHHHPDRKDKATCPYLGCFGLANSQGFPEVSIYSIIGFPFSLGRLDPVGNDLDYAGRGNIGNSQTMSGNNSYKNVTATFFFSL